MILKVLYFCVGCRQVHYDTDYDEKDGDLIITDWQNFLNSVDNLRDYFKSCQPKDGEK